MNLLESKENNSETRETHTLSDIFEKMCIKEFQGIENCMSRLKVEFIYLFVIKFVYLLDLDITNVKPEMNFSDLAESLCLTWPLKEKEVIMFMYILLLVFRQEVKLQLVFTG